MFDYVIPKSRLGEILRNNESFNCSDCGSIIDLTKAQVYKDDDIEIVKKDEDHVMLYRCIKCNNFYIISQITLDRYLTMNNTMVTCSYCEAKNKLTDGKWRLYGDVRREFEEESARITKKHKTTIHKR
jgi:DNA-directed RNA polymerase subunit RPC12/RpoP